jgi:hypothetical protein
MLASKGSDCYESAKNKSSSEVIISIPLSGFCRKTDSSKHDLCIQ